MYAKCGTSQLHFTLRLLNVTFKHPSLKKITHISPKIEALLIIETID